MSKEKMKTQNSPRPKGFSFFAGGTLKAAPLKRPRCPLDLSYLLRVIFSFLGLGKSIQQQEEWFAPTVTKKQWGDDPKTGGENGVSGFLVLFVRIFASNIGLQIHVRQPCGCITYSLCFQSCSTKSASFFSYIHL